jgi:hypothetical protein
MPQLAGVRHGRPPLRMPSRRPRRKRSLWCAVMPQRRRLTVLAAVLACIAAAPAPVPAFAQSAGDDQYEDPFAGQDPGGSQEPEQQQTPEPAEPAEPAAPAEPAQSAPAESSTPSAPVAGPASQQQPELPRTGLDAAPILALGAVLLGSGIALRVRLREQS